MSTPITKFYHAENSNRTIKSKGVNFYFTPYQLLAGTWHGLYKTAKANEQEALDELIKDPISAVTAVDEKEYVRCLQKKAHNEQRSGTWNAPQPPPPTTSRLEDAVTAGSPVTSELTPVPPDRQPITSVESALSVGSVTTGAALPGQEGNDPEPLNLPPIGVDLS